MPLPRSRAVRIVLAVTLAFVAGVVVTFAYFRSRGNELLQSRGQAWLASRIAVLSDSVYNVHLHRLRYETASRSLRFDSLVIRTDVVRNQARAVPLPTVTLKVYRGRLAGIELWEALSGRRIHASELGFDSVMTIMVLPSLFRDSAKAAGTPHAAPRDTADRTKLFVIGGDPGAAMASALATIDRLRFDNIHGRLVIPLEDGQQEIELQNLSVHLDQVAFDPRKQATTPFFVKDVQVEAHDFNADLGANHFALKSLAGSFADSVLLVKGVSFGPRGGDAGYMKGRRHRGTRARIGFDSLEVAGLDWNALVRSQGVNVRRIAVDRFELDLLLDKRLPANPVRTAKPYIQQRIARLRTTVTVDSVLLRDARVQYAEHAPGHPSAGRLRFERINGSVANFSNDPARQTDRTPLRLVARASFMGSGALDALIELPLLAKGLTGRYRATMGRMDATALNEMLTPLLDVSIKKGVFTSLVLDAHVRNGVYQGTLVPLFQDLQVSFPPSPVEQKKSHGIGGFFKGIKRGAMGVAANTVVRDDNPEKPGKPPKTGTVTHVRQPWESFWSGIWQSLKPALKESVVHL
jgi:hypothetical protein